MKTPSQSQEWTTRSRDPLTGERGAHPVGTSLGAAGRTTARAAAGVMAGGLTGNIIIAELIDLSAEDAYWRRNYWRRPYVATNATYEAYAPAYRVGYEGRIRYKNRRFQDAEALLKRNYEETRGESPLTWEQARQATREAWHRVERALPAAADNDRW